MSRAPDRFSLVADTGGTNTRVALAEGARLLPETVTRYPNADFPSLPAVLRAFLAAQGGVDCAGAAVAVAGPVRDGRGVLTNLDWEIDEPTLASVTGAEVAAVINDLQAQGHALGHLAPEMLRPVVDGAPAPAHATRLVIGVGTGFNAAPVLADGAARLVAPAEAGHVTLPVRTAQDLRLADWLARHHGFAAVEEVLSGRGLEHVHAFLGDDDGTPRSATAAEIMGALAEGRDRRAVETVRIFVRVLGTVAGDLALTTLPFGGVYLCGGVARAMLPWLEPFEFARHFRDKGRFGPFVAQFPVSVIEDDYAALIGLAHHLARLKG